MAQRTTGVHRLKEIAKKRELFCLATNVNDCVKKSAGDNMYCCRHSWPDGIMRTTDVIGENTTGRVIDRAIDRRIDRPSDRPNDRRAIERPSDRLNDQPTERGAE